MKITKNDKGQTEVTFSAILKSVSDVIFKNVNQTEYRVIGLEFIDAQGEKQAISGVMYETNYKNGVKLGESYLTKSTQTEKGWFTQMSHLTSYTNKATDAMFGAEAMVATEATVESLENKEN